jgi:hypothetical protein
MNRRRTSNQVIVRRTGRRLAVLGRVVLSIVGVGLVTGGAGYGLVRGWRWLHHAEKFALHDVRVTGTVRTTPEELVARGGLVIGSNIFGLDIPAAVRAMEAAPWVRQVRIAREWPDVVHVDVQEHEAAALAAAGALYAVGPDGRVFKRAEAAEKLDLPVLTGFEAAELEEGRQQALVRHALAIVAVYVKHPVHGRAPLAELHVDRSSGESVWTAQVGDDPCEVRLGVVNDGDPGQFLPDALDRFLLAWDESARRGLRLRFIDLGNRQRPDWMAARLDEAASARRPQPVIP